MSEILQSRLVASPLLRLALLGLVSLGGAAVMVNSGAHDGLMMPAILLGALISSIAGFAFSAICGAVLFHLDPDHVQVVQIMITCSIANQAAMTWAGRRDINWPGLSLFLAGGVCGLGIGVWVLLHAEHHLYLHGLGVFLLCYGLFMLLRRPVTLRRQYAALDVGVGFLGGITGGVAGFPGASVTIWCGMKGWDKARQRAMFQPFILIMQVAGLLAISVARSGASAGIGFDPRDLLFIPASLFGTSLGMMLYSRLSDLQFARAVDILLIACGLSYLV